MDRQERECLIQQYAEGPARLASATATVPTPALKWRPAPDAWSAHEIVCHCADAEAMVATRIRMLVAEGAPLIAGIDQDAWTQAFDYHALSLEPALGAVAATRAHTVEELRRFPEAAWLREGHHPERGRYSATEWLRMYASHLHDHAQQIEGNVAAWTTHVADGEE